MNIIDLPTRVNSTFTLSDIIIVSDCLEELESGILPVDVSDHFTTY